MARVMPSDVQTWVNGLAAEKSSTVVLRAHGVLAGILDNAVRDRRIIANPARGVELPGKTRRRRSRYLSHADVRAVAEASKHPKLV